MLRFLAIGIFLTCFHCFALGQGNLLKEAASFFEEDQYEEALNVYTTYNRNNPGNEFVLTRLGICNYYIGNTAVARQSLNAVLTTAKKPDKNVYLYMAKSLHAEGLFQEAAEAYKNYLGNTKLDDSMRKHVRDAIRRCGSGLRLQAQKADAIVENIGDAINTNQDDYGAVLSPTYADRIYFSSVRPFNIGGRRNSKNEFSPKFGSPRSDVYAATIVNGSWGDINPIGGNRNSPQDDQVLDFTGDGQALILSRTVNGYAGDVIVDTFSTDGIQRKGSFTAPINGKQGDGGLVFHNDTTILFYSNREGGFGGFDLYAAFYSKGSWSSAYNLGQEVNSAYDEISPFMSVDGSTLYFSSNRPESMGGFDIFRSNFEVGRQAWNVPTNLGAPINSGRDDYHFRLDRRGLQAYLTSNRPGGLGLLDIYIVYFKNYLSEQQSDNVIASLSGLASSNAITLISPQEVSYDESQIKNYNIKPVYYDDNDRIITPANMSTLDEVSRILNDNTSIQIEIVGSSDKSASLEFDLYFSIKRAEEVATYLQQKGITSDRIICRGTGQSYPNVRHEINGQPVLLAKRLNRRVDFIFKNTEGLPIEIDVEKPSVNNSSFEMPGIERLRNQSAGISYRVKIALTNSMYNGDIISEYPDALIDKPVERPLYRYTVGLYSTYQSAQFMKNDLVKRGVEEATVVPFYNGKELNKETALPLVDKAPDLANYLVNE